MKKQSDWHQGYCYQFWRCRHGAFRGDGAFGQYTIVMPEQDAVLAITSETSNMQGELDLVWEHLLPAMTTTPLPADTVSQAELHKRLSLLALAPPRAAELSPLSSKLSGKVFQLQVNDLGAKSVSFDFPSASVSGFSLRDERGEHRVNCGSGRWVDGQTAMPGTPPTLTYSATGFGTPVAAAATWKSENTFEMTWRYYETPHHDTITCRFDGDKVRIEFLNSITQLSSSHKEKRPVLEGVCTSL
jgi:hypothetical protein